MPISQALTVNLYAIQENTLLKTKEYLVLSTIHNMSMHLPYAVVFFILRNKHSKF